MTGTLPAAKSACPQQLGYACVDDATRARSSAMSEIFATKSSTAASAGYSRRSDAPCATAHGLERGRQDFTRPLATDRWQHVPMAPAWIS